VETEIEHMNVYWPDIETETETETEIEQCIDNELVT